MAERVPVRPSIDPWLLIACAAAVGPAFALHPVPTTVAVLAAVAIIVRTETARIYVIVISFVLMALGTWRAARALAAAETAYADAQRSLSSPRRCALRGVVARSPVVMQGKLPPRGPPTHRARIDVDVHASRCDEDRGAPIVLPAGVRVRLYGAPEHLARGDRVDAIATVALVRLFDNPASPDPMVRLSLTSVVASGSALDVHAVERASTPASAIDRARAFVRGRIRATYAAEVAPFARALVLGETDLTDGDREAFRLSGLAHLLAVSGTHLVIAVIALGRLLRGLFVRIPSIAARMDPGRISAAICAALALVYADFAGGGGSADRAATMLAFAMIARAAGRYPSIPRCFAWSILVGVLMEPLVICELSFALSLAATAGLLAIRDQLAASARKGWFYLGTVGAAQATTAAMIGCAPIILTINAELPTLGVAANLLAAPIGELAALPLALVHTISWWHPPLEQGLATLASGALWIVRAIAHATAAPPWSTIPLPTPTTWQFAVIAVALIAYKSLKAPPAPHPPSALDHLPTQHGTIHTTFDPHPLDIAPRTNITHTESNPTATTGSGANPSVGTVNTTAPSVPRARPPTAPNPPAPHVPHASPAGAPNAALRVPHASPAGAPNAAALSIPRASPAGAPDTAAPSIPCASPAGAPDTAAPSIPRASPAGAPNTAAPSIPCASPAAPNTAAPGGPSAGPADARNAPAPSDPGAGPTGARTTPAPSGPGARPDNVAHTSALGGVRVSEADSATSTAPPSGLGPVEATDDALRRDDAERARGASSALPFFVTRRRRTLRLLTMAVAVFAIGAFEMLARHEGRPRGELRVTALDVGQGDALLIDMPDGRVMLVDGGGFVGSPIDTWRRVLAPELRARRRTTVDVLVLSHPHPDHYGGLVSLLAAGFDVGQLWSSGLALAAGLSRSGAGSGVRGRGAKRPTSRTASGTIGTAGEHAGDGHARGAPRQGGGASTVARSLREAKARGVELVTAADLCDAAVEFGGARVEVIGPCPTFHPDRSANDNSVVLRLSYGERAALLVGDAEREQEHALVATHDAAGASDRGTLRADLLKVGHHGSKTSSTPPFVEAVAPHLAIISCGVRNRFGHPHPVTLQTLAGHDVDIKRTDIGGAFVWATDGKTTRWRRARGAWSAP